MPSFHDRNAPDIHDPRLVIRRRDALKMGAAGAAFLAGLAFPLRSTRADTATPSLTEGPFWVDEQLNRSDVRSDPSTGVLQAGLPLRLMVNVSKLTSGTPSPLVGAWVDIWHASGAGAYSDEPAGMGNPNTSGQKWLRGYQVTDSHGNVKFTTIYPGWYIGRTVHIHCRIRTWNGTTVTNNFTTQFFFDDTTSTNVFNRLSSVYNHSGTRILNSGDNIYTSAGSVVLLRMADDNSHAEASFNVKVNLSGSAMRLIDHHGVEMACEDDHEHDFGGGTPSARLRNLVRAANPGSFFG